MRDTITAKHVFDAQELNDIARQMAHRLQDIEQKEAEKKSINSQLKADIDSLQAQVSKLLECYRSGYEYRSVVCEVELDFDAKVRRYRSIETKEYISEEPLRSEDYQTSAFPD